jgi:hypothetical protein
MGRRSMQSSATIIISSLAMDALKIVKSRSGSTALAKKWRPPSARLVLRTALSAALMGLF